MMREMGVPMKQNELSMLLKDLITTRETEVEEFKQAGNRKVPRWVLAE